MAIPFEQQVVFLPVADLEASTGFYTGALEMQLVLDQGVCRIFRSSSDAFVGVCRREGAEPSKGVILTLVSSQVDAWAAKLNDRGVAVDRGPLLNEEFNIYHLFTKDPDGHLIEIQQFLDPAWPEAGTD